LALQGGSRLFDARVRRQRRVNGGQRITADFEVSFPRRSPRRLSTAGRQGLPCPLTRPISGGTGGCQGEPTGRAKPVVCARHVV
jgi:hypothetical protein